MREWPNGKAPTGLRTSGGRFKNAPGSIPGLSHSALLSSGCVQTRALASFGVIQR